MIKYSPSSFNLQPWKIKIISDQKTKDKLLPIAWNQTQINTCSHLFIFCADTNVKGLIDELEQTILDKGTPKDKIKGYIDMMRGFEQKIDDNEKLLWAQNQNFIALSNLMNGAKSLGIDSCPMGGFDAAALHKELNLPKNLVPAVICPIGYADDKPMPKIRFDNIFI